MTIAALLIVAAVGATNLYGQKGRHDPDEGTLSSVRPRIPEPMVYDLIRPLGAEKGEFEVNSLFRIKPAQYPATLQWAP